MLSKSQVLKSIRNLPDEFTVEEIIDRIILLQKIDIGDEQSKKGEVFTVKQKEDLGLLKLMQKTDRSKKVSKNQIMTKLKAK